MTHGNQFADGLTLASPLQFEPGMRCTLKVNDSKVTVITEGWDASRVHRRVKIREESGHELWVDPIALTPSREKDRPTKEHLFRGLEVFSAELVKHRSRCSTCRELYERGIMLSGTCLINRQLIWEYAAIQGLYREAEAAVEETARDTLW